VKRARTGFTLLEVMVGLSLLGFGLVVLMKSAAGSIFGARQAQMMGVVTDLSRGKMYDLEETLLKDGFNETGLADATDDCTDWEKFEDEGWPSVEWCAKIEQVELPSWDQIQALAQGQGSGSGSAAAMMGSGSDGSAGGGFMDSALGGMLGMLGGGFGASDIEGAEGASFIQSQYSMVQEVLKVSIRKVSLFTRWEVMGRKREMQTVAFFTDAASMDKVLQGLGSQEPAAGSGSGSGTGSGSGSGTRTPTRSTGSGSGKTN
jgi:prepilin-type N-terminal cleavage/methylation domain-containing protein